MKRFPGIRLPLFFFVGLWTAGIARATDTTVAREFAGATPLQWSARMADSEIGRRGESLIYQEGGRAKWDYSVGLFTLSRIESSAVRRAFRTAASRSRRMGRVMCPATAKESRMVNRTTQTSTRKIWFFISAAV